MGYFAFGGSTCVLVLPPGMAEWDADIAANSASSVETLVRVGEQIGVKRGSALAQDADARVAISRTLSQQLDEHMRAQPSMLHILSQASEVWECSAVHDACMLLSRVVQEGDVVSNDRAPAS